MKKYTLHFTLALLIAMISITLSAASVFHKDGSIVEGRMIRTKAKSVTLALSGTEKKTIQRHDILRILYRDDYKELKYIYTLDKSYLVGHIVEDGPDYYMVRFKLDAPAEIRVPKKQIKFVSKKYLVLEEEYSEITADGKKRWGRFSLLLGTEARVQMLMPEWKDMVNAQNIPNTIIDLKFNVSPLYQVGFSGEFTLTENFSIAADYHLGYFYASNSYTMDGSTDYYRSANLFGISNDLEVNGGYSFSDFFTLWGGLKLTSIYLDGTERQVGFSTPIKKDYTLFGVGPIIGFDFSFNLPGAWRISNLLSLYLLVDTVSLNVTVVGSKDELYISPGFSNRLTLEYNFRSLNLTVFGGVYVGAEFFHYIGEKTTSYKAQVTDPRITVGGLIGVKYLLRF